MAIYECLTDIFKAQNMREAFHAAAEAGQKYLLIMKESCDDELIVRDFYYPHGVAAQEEIVPYLADQNEGRGQETAVSLCGIYDLTRNFEDQYAKRSADQREETLTPSTKADLSRFEAEQTARFFREAERRRWKEASLLEKIFWSPK
jgi:hypothetical protein